MFLISHVQMCRSVHWKGLEFFLQTKALKKLECDQCACKLRSLSCLKWKKMLGGGQGERELAVSKYLKGWVGSPYPGGVRTKAVDSLYSGEVDLAWRALWCSIETKATGHVEGSTFPGDSQAKALMCLFFCFRAKKAFRALSSLYLWFCVFHFLRQWVLLLLLVLS